MNPEIQFKEITNKDGFLISKSLDGTEPATAANYGIIFTAPFKCELIAASVVWQTAGSVSSTLNLERLQGTEALDAGDELFAADLATTTTANTVNYPALIATRHTRVFEKGDRLAQKDGGTLTDLAGLQTTVVFHPIGKGHYSTI
jgi:hypothetical protein